MQNSETIEFLWLAIALFSGLMLTRVFNLTGKNFPDVTAFLIAGILIGPNVLGRLHIEGLGFVTYESIDNLKLLSDTALGFITFFIGKEFKLSEIKEIGKQATVIGIFQALSATAFVDIGLIILHFILGEEVLPLTACIVLGAIASATAPAATLMIINQYKAKGPVTKILLPIVALDDAVGLVIFSISLGIAQAMNGSELNIYSILINPLLEILCSLILGSIVGLILSEIEKLFRSNTNRISISISFVLLTIALSSIKLNLGKITISFSTLLVCMMLGTTLCNINENSDEIMERTRKWASPLNACFFVLSGAALQLNVFANYTYIVIGILYIILRSLGKYIGARLSSKAMKCDENIVKYLGITLLPQAGVALGMCKQSVVLGSSISTLIINITLFGVLIYELIGPTLTRNALISAGEIKTK